MADKITTLGRSIIQHGPKNDRIYLMKLFDDDLPGLLDDIDHLATENGYGKVFAKVPSHCISLFSRAGYATEALVPYFFEGREDSHFMAKYYSKERSFESDQQTIAKVISLVRQEPPVTRENLPEDLELTICKKEDCEEMARLYDKVFDSYPFPIQDQDFLDQSMNDNVIYFGVRNTDGDLVALAAAEQDLDAANVEMTDFVTLYPYRRQGLAGYLLQVMEEKMRKKKMAVAYTIARAKSVGMNKAFACSGYMFGGTLIRNTHICGIIESMNVWHKRL